MHTIPVQSAGAQYHVQVGEGVLAGLASSIALLGNRRLFVLTSPPIWALWGQYLLRSLPAGGEPHILFLPPGEQHKRLVEVERLLEELAIAGADRSSVLLAFGGGIVGDVGGFLAAIYMRGIAYIQVPTTLLAQVDSSVGGKTGANLAAGKNLAGAFYPPAAVFADIAVLRTLPARELRAGLMESVKAGIIRDANFFSLLEERGSELLRPEADPALLAEVVARSVAIKAGVVSADEREGGLRMILNLGHTVGHAIEAATHYSVLLHGEAVGWGMLVALHVAAERGLVSSEQGARMSTVIRSLGALPSFAAPPDALLQASGRDKKNQGGRRRFVLPRGIGDAVVLEDVSDAELLAGIEPMVNEALYA